MNDTQRLMASLRMRQLELVSTLADAGTMRAAGLALCLSTAAVSKGLREIESLFGVALFHRLPRGVVATSAGELVIARARLLLSEVGQLADALRENRSGANPTLKIGGPPFLAWTWVPAILHVLQAEGNPPPVRIIEGRLVDICRKLEAGDIDVLITMNTPSELGALKPDGFVIERVGSEPWIAVCAPGHPLARRSEPMPWADLRTAAWILPPRPTHARMMVEQLLLQQGLPPIAPAIESTNAITNLELAERSLGLTLLARCACADRLARGTLVEVPLATAPPPVPIALVYRLNAAHHGAVAAFRAAAQALRAAGPGSD
ncbi:LysR family transcriptional regulator [Pigmentiphaga litoralis]|uniref:LysR family transcriptional regulator n=1 Tax=Pigmentiphaga litoralis TaxID=516702 RepID=UPI003B42EDC7